MSLLNILILILAALVLRLAFPGKLRRWAMLVASVVAIFWLQPALPIRQMDFWLPVATLGLIFFSWGLTAEKDQLKEKTNWLAAALTVGTVLLIAATRFISLEGILTASRPPQFLFSGDWLAHHPAPDCSAGKVCAGKWQFPDLWRPIDPDPVPFPEEPDALHPFQYWPAGHYVTGPRPGAAHRPGLAWFLLRRIPPDPYPYRPDERAA